MTSTTVNAADANSKFISIRQITTRTAVVANALVVANCAVKVMFGMVADVLVAVKSATIVSIFGKAALVPSAASSGTNLTIGTNAFAANATRNATPGTAAFAQPAAQSMNGPSSRTATHIDARSAGRYKDAGWR
jgi:hypothetical protein